MTDQHEIDRLANLDRKRDSWRTERNDLAKVIGRRKLDGLDYDEQLERANYLRALLEATE